MYKVRQTITKNKPMKKLRNYTYNILVNEIVIFEQASEDENTFNCLGQIVIQLRKEGFTQRFNLLNKPKK